MGDIKKKISIVIPCYNEEESLDILFLKLADVERIIKSKYDLEIIFINDGSIDDTHEKLAKRYDGRNDISIVTYEKNHGYGYALKKGFKKASGDFVISIDADTNYEHREIPDILVKMENSPDIDIVIASPFSQNENGAILDFDLFLVDHYLEFMVWFFKVKKVVLVRTLPVLGFIVKMFCLVFFLSQMTLWLTQR